MPKPVQLVQFDADEREVLLEAGQPKAIETAMRAVTARMKRQLKVVAELASDKSVGASPERLTEARAGLEANLAVLKVCPAGEVADLRDLMEHAAELLAEALQISVGLVPAPVEDPRVMNSPIQAHETESDAEFGQQAHQ
ncbi:hypothetical protein ABZ502_32615 [Streptomyces abikoensis]|uniref:hypothetical protein n=1 Tax=Streptomyces abikoensis TaxID=97398 RepID=UPI0033FA836E